MSKMNWARARKQALGFAADQERTRPARGKFKPKKHKSRDWSYRPPAPPTWRILITSTPTSAQIREFGLQLVSGSYRLDFATRDLMRALRQRLIAAGLHGVATPLASDRRSSGTQDRNATAGTLNDRPDQ